jgi:hypothetical protein
MSVYFHGNFGLNREHMAKILLASLKNPQLSDLQLAVPFGYKAPFTARHRAWLYRAGIAEKGLPLRLTELGGILVKHDPQLASDTALWFIHHQLTSDPERSETWHFFVKKFLPKNKDFTKDDLFMGLVKQLSPHSEQHFGMMSSMNKVIVRKLVDCYLNDTALGKLGFVTQKEDRFYAHKPKEMGPWKSAKELGLAMVKR